MLPLFVLHSVEHRLPALIRLVLTCFELLSFLVSRGAVEGLKSALEYVRLLAATVRLGSQGRILLERCGVARRGRNGGLGQPLLNARKLIECDVAPANQVVALGVCVSSNHRHGRVSP